MKIPSFRASPARVVVRDQGPDDGPELSRSGAPSYGGWSRVDPDNVVRGWVTDRHDRAARLEVEVLIDDEPVARAVADRFDPKLFELGEGDGRYAFAVVLPEAARDGQRHAFAVQLTDGSGFRLKSKRDSFQTPVNAPLPSITLAASGFTGASGQLSGLRGDDLRLELWRGGVRVVEDLAPIWQGSPADGRFIVRLPAELITQPGPEWLLATPGLIEADLPGATVQLPTSLSVTRKPDGLLMIALKGAPAFPEPLEIKVRVGDGEPLLSAPMDLSRGPAPFRLPARLDGASVRIGLAAGGHEAPWLTARPQRTLGRLMVNSSFETWTGAGPDDWTIAPGVIAVRGFHAFTGRAVEAQRMSGDFVHVELPAATPGQPVLVLSQPIEDALAAGDEIEAALLARASAPARLRVRVVDGEGELAGLDLSAPRSWAWAHIAQLLVLHRAGPGARLELTAAPMEPAESFAVDVAGLRLGEGGFADAKPVSLDRFGGADERVLNADLSDWPRGLATASILGRGESARGWFVGNRRASTPVLVRPWFLEDRPESVGFIWAAADVPSSCRLEVALDAAGMATFSHGLLSFEAGTPPAARRLLASSTASAPEFAVIERIAVLKRTSTPVDGGFTVSDTVLATVARRLLLTRELHRFELPVDLRGSAEADLDAGAESEAEYFLAMQFGAPFAMAVIGLSLTPGGPTVAPASPPHLALEDRSIAAQAASTEGLAGWLSPEIATPRSRSAPASGEPLRWRSERASHGSVELVVCVHNAVEETLACLRSLCTTSETPHTVHIIDDASDALVAGRLDAFIVDKPWMRITRNTVNEGYTRSADKGVRAARSDWVVLLNSDTVATPGWLEGLLEAAASDPAIAFVGPVSNAATFQSVPELYAPNQAFMVNSLPAGWSPADMAAYVARVSDHAFPQTPLLNGFCTLIRRSVFLELGGFNAGAFPAGYGEENDLCTRAVKAGHKLVVADHVYVHHHKSASFGSERRAELAKEGSRALKLLHPDVDYGALTAGFRDLPALVNLRAAVRRAYGEG